MLIILCLSFLVIILLIRKIIIFKLELKNISKQLEEDDSRKISNISLKYICNDIEKFAEIYNKRANQINNVIAGNEKNRRQFKRMLREMMHDFKTPITVIIGYAELLEEGDLNDFEKKYINSIKRRSEHLNKLIVKMNDYFSIENNLEANYTEIIDVRQIILNSLGDLYEYINERGVKVSTDITKEKILIRADADILNRIFENVFTNAAKYTNDGCFEVKCICLADSICRVEVANAAEYFSEDELEMVFELFYRKDISRHDNSSGIGLSIVKSYMDKIGGNVYAKYNNGKFIITLEFYDLVE